MSDQRFSDETLMAFADGELSPEEYASVEQAMETDADLAARVAAFMESRSAAQGALAPLLAEPVPDELASKVSGMLDQSSTVVDFPSTPATVSPRRWALPIAASIALVAGGLGGYVAGVSSTQQTLDTALDTVSQPAIVTALNSVASGEEKDLGDGGRFRAIASYRDASETLCREFEVDRTDNSTIVAVACRADRLWEYRFSVMAGQTHTGYAPASSLEALDAYLNAVGASDPLSPEDEATALRAAD